MCGPSSNLKAINNKIQDFSDSVTSEAKTVFGDASDVFNNLKGSLQKIVNAGVDQQGFSAAEKSARDAEIINSGSTMARNLRGAAASGVASIGGGNTVAPAGSTQQTILDANTKAAQETAEGLNKNTQENFATGRENYFNAVGAEEKLPDVFNPVTSFNKSAQEGEDQAQKSQQSIDTANNWWQPLITGAVGSAVGAFTGGVGKGLATKALGGWGTSADDSDKG